MTVDIVTMGKEFVTMVTRGVLVVTVLVVA